VGELDNSEGLTHAVSVAYSALISLFPMLLLSLAILGEVTADAGELWRRRHAHAGVGVAFSLFAWNASDLATWNVVHGSIAAVGVFLI